MRARARASPRSLALKRVDATRTRTTTRCAREKTRRARRGTTTATTTDASRLERARSDGARRGAATRAAAPRRADVAGTANEAVARLEGAARAWATRTLGAWTPPKFLWRSAATGLLFGSVLYRCARQPRRVNWEQTLQQIARVGPQTLGVSLLTSSFVGMVFTIQFCKEFAKVGLKNAIGGLLGLAFARELTPVICAIVLTGRIGSSIAAELGTMQVTEQVDQLTVLGTDPVDYLVIPRVIACAVSLPILSIISFAQALGASILLADLRYGVSPNVIIDSAAKYLEPSDIGIMTAKSIAFGAVIAVISCGWGTTTTGGAKGVGESTTASVVISLTAIFVVDFVLSLVFFQK